MKKKQWRGLTWDAAVEEWGKKKNAGELNLNKEINKRDQF